MNIPLLDAAKKAVWFYYVYILEHEAMDLAGLPLDIDAGYGQTEDEAKKVNQRLG